MANKSQGGKQTSLRGFASMDKNMQREIASQGGRAAHRSGNAHEFTSEEARAAGRLSHKNSANRSRSSENRGSESGGNRSGSDMGSASGHHASADSHEGNK
jgi:general stress protein YciG